MKIIQLTNVEALPTGIYFKDEVTHLKICKYEEEIYREFQFESKLGYYKIYLAKCFKSNGIYIEVPGWPGIEITLSEEDYEELRGISTTQQPFKDDVTEIIGQFIINKGYVDGILVEEGD